VPENWGSAVVVFQHRNIDQDMTPLRQNLRKPAANTAGRHQFFFIADSIRTEALDAVFRGRNSEPGMSQLFGVAIPNNNVAGSDSGVLQPLADGFEKLQIAGQSSSPEGIHLESHLLPRTDQPFPRLDRVIEVEEGLHGAIQQAQDPA